jgi:uncharacterized protein (TIGR03086 family)
VRATLDGSVELLDRALAYTRVRLAGVRDDLLDRPTPCAGWSLADLLAHMDDALDAFTEAAGGRVEVHAPEGAVGHVAVIEEKACALLGMWSGPRPGDVVISDGDGGLDLGSPLLVATAALEVTVHGWDVGQSTGARTALPDELARALLPVARAVVAPGDRGVRFAPARAVDPEASYGARLLAFLGRSQA